MSGPAIITLGIAAAIVAVSIIAQRTRREGETFMHAYERILNTDEHKEREQARLAGLSEATPPPAAPPDGRAADDDV